MTAAEAAAIADDLTARYERVPGALARWRRDDGAEIMAATYGAHWHARLPDGTTRNTYRMVDALRWIDRQMDRDYQP